jgi:energy-coupling factor transporter ATP-binding protein EcfA2
MIRRITIENFKSIQKLDLELGRVNVLIGENGCGKTNILEAIAFAGTGTGGKVVNEFLAPRGIRVTEPRFMRSAFLADDPSKEIRVGGTGEPSVSFDFSIRTDDDVPHAQWLVDDPLLRKVTSLVQKGFAPDQGAVGVPFDMAEKMLRLLHHGTLDEHGSLSDFHIYAPENSTLRFFQPDAQVRSLGVKGEGLFAYLKTLSERNGGTLLAEIVDRLGLLGWFDRFEIPRDLVAFENRIDIRDRYLAEGTLFDQRSANEGFLFLLFYFTLLISPDTPAFFAIDNIDTSLNPKLCAELMRQIVELAEKYDKQVILTTHNPATLDGLDREGPEQRLLVVYRSIDGDTCVHRSVPLKPIEGARRIFLSEAFMRGYLGGLPENF